MIRQKLNSWTGFIQEAVLCMHHITRQREAIADICAEAKDALGIPPKIFKKLTKDYVSAGTLDVEENVIEETKVLRDAIDAAKSS